MIQKLQGEKNQDRVDVVDLTKNFENIHIVQEQNEKRGPIQLMNSFWKQQFNFIKFETYKLCLSLFLTKFKFLIQNVFIT
ncbi:unnamed protein product [Paramecium octaurelia]|uniref:Uncharacterized protein n=1 Tax=Paramecium octaurelia TaxID=43137 RepID=A0A8S1VB68_PAROT|nr:unnamed protein product [Paramecium octaurelia]